MKNLLYKEFKLVSSPAFYLLIALFTLLPLIPNYPKSVSYFYIITFYPLTFLGANKGTLNNDTYFSVTLPVSRKKIIMARLIFLSLLQFSLMALTSVTMTLGKYIEGAIESEAGGIISIGLGFDNMLALFGFTLVSFAIMDLIFVPMFYRTCKNFSLPFILSMIVFAIVLSVLDIILPMTSVGFNEIFVEWNTVNQIVTFLVGLVFYVVIRYVTLHLGNIAFKKVDL